MFKPLKTLVIPVAGRATRFLPATKVVSKELLPVLNRPLIQYLLDEALAAGFDTFVFITGANQIALRQYVSEDTSLETYLKQKGEETLSQTLKACNLDPRSVHFIQQATPLGLGHAVGCAQDIVGNNPFAVALPDDLILGPVPCLQEMAKSFQKTQGANMVAMMPVDRLAVSKYGVMSFAPSTENSDMLRRLKGVVEKPSPEQAPSSSAIVGRYILNPEIFKDLDRQAQDHRGEIQLTDALQSLIQKQPTYGLRFSGQRFDCGQQEGWLQANLHLALQDPTLKLALKSFWEKRTFSEGTAA